MGTHPNGPSKLSEGYLYDFLKSNPSFLGSKITALFGNDLPFLFKVLSISKALSIQAHPDKSLAESLNKKFPHIYKDSNHKPEMAIALTSFEALSGFRTDSAIKNNLKNYPELKELLDEAIVMDFMKSSGPFVKESLRKLFSCLMKLDDSKIKQSLVKLMERIQSLPNKSSTDELIKRLYEQYPGDVGCFCVLFLNYVKLEPLQAFYMGPNEPHAYISGECLECMATSDNVVRAGLTPKFKDVDVLCSMLTYESTDPQEQLLVPSKYRAYSSLYAPPIAEFSVLVCNLERGNKEHYDPFDGPSIFICVKGKGNVSINGSEHEVEMGSVLFVPFNSRLEFSSHGDFLFALAFCSQ